MGGSNWPIFSFTFLGEPTLSSIFSVIYWSILKILVPMLVQIPWILLNPRAFHILMLLNKVMQETRKICTTENGPIWATPKNLPFFKDEIYQLFSYSFGSKVPKWKCAHILLCKKYKNYLELPLTECKEKKTPCIYISNHLKLLENYYYYKIFSILWNLGSIWN